nr:hypothetical protein [Fusobacterium gastrosuis]
MQELVKLNLEEIKNILPIDQYEIIYIDYNRENGIKKLNSIEGLLNENQDFYKVYIFNDELMMTIYNFGYLDYKYNLIKKEEINQEEEKEIYIKYYGKRIKLRIGTLKETPSRRVFQYIGFIGGEK